MLEQSRIVYGDDLVPGSVVLEWCSGKYCQKGTNHRMGSFHELSILRFRKKGPSLVRCVTVDESGNQQPLMVGKNDPVRVKFE